MAETPTIKPSAPPTVAPTGTGSAPVTPTAPATPAPATTLLDTPVASAPPQLTLPQVRVQETGIVIANNPQTQMITLQTPQGEVAVKSPTPLPLNAQVMLEFFTDKSQTLANIVVMKQSAETAKTTENIAQPAPSPLPAKEGQTVTALMLPRSTTAQTPASGVAPPSNPLPKGEGAAVPPPQISFPPPAGEGLSEGLTAPTIQKQTAAYQTTSFNTKPDMPATPASAAQDDNSLAQVLSSQLKTKPTAQAAVPAVEVKPSPAPMPAPVARAIDTLVTIAQSMKPQQQAMPFSALPQVAAPPLPQNMYQLKIIKIFPPDTPSEKIQAAVQKPEPGMQLAKVEAFTATAAPLLKTATGEHFVLKTPVTIPAGSTVVITATPMTPQQIMDMPEQPIPAGTPLADARAVKNFDPFTSETWPTLHEALQAMKQTAPGIAQPLHQTLPTPTQQMVPTTLFFLAALRLGSVESWLGAHTLQALRDIGRKDLAEKLGDDFGRLSTQSRTPLSDEWKSFSIPLMHDEQLSQMQFYVRQQHERHSGKNDKEKPVTRFIMNLHMSRMGELQLDGYLHKKQFDIILRTQDKLPFDMRQELMKRFAQGLEQTNMQGGISFQTKQQSWVSIELPQHTATLA